MTINARADITSTMGNPKQTQAEADLLRCSDGGIERQAMATCTPWTRATWRGTTTTAPRTKPS